VLLLGVLFAASAWSCEQKRQPSTVSASPSPTSAVAPAVQRSQHTASGDALLDVATSVDRTDITVADRIRFSLTCTTRPSATLTLPDFEAQFGDFTVVSSSRHDQLAPSGNRETTVLLVLEPFLAAQKTIPSISVQALDAGRTLKLKTEPVVVQVAAVADPKADDKTPLEAPKTPVALILPANPSRLALWTTLGCALFASATALCFVAVASSRRSKREADPVFRVRRELEAVRTRLAQGTTRAHAAIASDDLFRCFAAYLAIVLDIPAGTQPHATITAAIAASPRLAFEDRTELNALLADLERTRFAPDGASIPIVQSLLDRVTAFVKRTSASEGQP
jgi:hypothetical protein